MIALISSLSLPSERTAMARQRLFNCVPRLYSMESHRAIMTLISNQRLVVPDTGFVQAEGPRAFLARTLIW